METINSVNDHSDLLSRNETLSAELARCKQDKDFISKLWKELQVENPNTTNMINSVIEREKEKSDAKDLKVLMIFEQKDKQINILQEVSEDQQTQANLANERISELLIQISNSQKKGNDAEGENNRIKCELDYTKELLKTKEKQLLLAENSRQEIGNEMNELLQAKLLYKKTVDTLKVKLEAACNQIEDLKDQSKSKDEELKFVVNKLENEVNGKLELLRENEGKENNIKKLKETIAKKCKEYHDINENLEMQDDVVVNNKQTIQMLSKQLEDKADDIQHLKDHMQRYEQYPKQIKEQIQLIQNLEKLQRETQHVLSQQEVTHQQEIIMYQNTTYELKVAITKVQKEAAMISSENRNLKKNNISLENTCDELHQRENSLQQELVTVSLELESSQNKLNTIPIEEVKNNDDNNNGSLLNSCTQTSPSKLRFVYIESATQTDEYLSSDNSEQISQKVKRKKEKLHTEAQRLLMLKSEINQENRNLKKRIVILENQCNQLQEEKLFTENNAKQLHENNEKLNIEIVDTFQKLEITTDVLQKRSKQLEECTKELQTISTNQLKENIASKNVTSKLKLTEEELQVATTNCSKISFQLKALCGENEILMEKQKSFQERITKLEKLLNQKKSFIEELKAKHNEAKTESEKKSDIIENIHTKLRTVAERENKDKLYIQKLKMNNDNLIKDKCNLQGLLDVLKTENKGKTRLLQETQQICHQAETAITMMEHTASQQIKNEQKLLKDVEAKLNLRYNKSTSRVHELTLVVKSFAESLLLQIHEKRGNVLRKNKESKPLVNKEDIFQKNACDVACSILNMSATDLEEFMEAGISSDTEFCKYKDNDIREKLGLILEKEDNFGKILTHFLLDLVEYYWSEKVKDND